MRYLIVNADDFGASRGINRAVRDLYECGAVTSASLMVAMPAASDAVKTAKAAERLAVGLHVALTDEEGKALVDFDDSRRCAQEVASQVERFTAALNRLPTHLDSHQNVHRDARLRPIFIELARRHGIPLREHSPVRYFSNFYGQWEDGESHPEHISIDNLLHMLDAELRDGILELSCHPGYPHHEFASPYDRERAIEVRTLSDPRFLEYLRARGVTLISFADVETVLHAV